MSRDLAAWLARELTPVTLRELSAAFGLTHPDSVRNLIRRADHALLGSRPLRDEIEAIRHRLPKTGPDPTKPPLFLLILLGCGFAALVPYSLDSALRGKDLRSPMP